MFAISPVLRLRVLLVAGLIAVTSLLSSTMATSQTTAPNEWTWMGGSSTASFMPNDAYNGLTVFGQPGVYGTLGTPAAGNIPGSREGASTWTDSSGNFWLFGGMGYDASGNGGLLNDLWEFNPSNNEWTWISGSNAVGQIPSPPNAPGPSGREYASSWIDSSGNLWLFGGNGLYFPNPLITGGGGIPAGGGGGDLNDLWEFNPSTKTWTLMAGSEMCPASPFQMYPSSCNNVSAKYGTLGGPGTPGERDSAASWIDSSGNLWLFGGNGTDADGKKGWLNDLWEFTGGGWVWMGGSSTFTSGNGFQPGVYGPLGSSSTTYIPSGRSGSSTWTDSKGNLWLFGGQGEVGLYSPDYKDLGYLNDLWEFNPSTGEWTWMSGSSTLTSPGQYSAGVPGQPGVYGTQGTPGTGNVPGGRWYATSWTDSNGNLWLFGGQGFDGNGDFGFLSDLWRFEPSNSEWTWMAGSFQNLITTSGQPGVYGTLDTPAEGNNPGGRQNASGWTDKNGNLWLFGGQGEDANWYLSELNDLWEYQPSESPLSPAAVPVVSSVSPNFATVGSPNLFLTVNGSGFTSRSTIYTGTIMNWTDYWGPTKLTTFIGGPYFATAGSTAVTVQTPAPGGGTSNSSVSFTVGPATGTITGPTFTSLTATVTAGTPATYTVTLPSGVESATVSCLNLPAGATCSYSAGVVTITTSASTPKGSYQITVVFTETVSGAASGWILLPILLLPLMFLRKRLAARGVWTTACLGLVLMAATAFSTGCGGGGGGSTGGGGGGGGTQTHQVTSSVAVTLTVQ